MALDKAFIEDKVGILTGIAMRAERATDLEGVKREVYNLTNAVGAILQEMAKQR